MNMEPAVFIRTMRIVIFALTMGIVTFIGIVVWMQTQGRANVGGAQSEMIAYAGLAALAGAILLQPVILGAMDKVQASKIDAKSQYMMPWYTAYQTRAIVGSALIEGASFLCLVGSMLDGRPLGILGGVVGAAAILALHFPSEMKLATYIERQRGQIV
jgi:branched-subunit amino acid transport protein